MVDEVVEDGAAEVVVKKGVGSFVFDFFLASNTIISGWMSLQRPIERSTKKTQILSHLTFKRIILTNQSYLRTTGKTGILSKKPSQ